MRLQYVFLILWLALSACAPQPEMTYESLGHKPRITALHGSALTQPQLTSVPPSGGAPLSGGAPIYDYEGIATFHIPSNVAWNSSSSSADQNCDDIGVSNINVEADDPNNFDGDNDGIGCED